MVMAVVVVAERGTNEEVGQVNRSKGRKGGGIMVRGRAR